MLSTARRRPPAPTERVAHFRTCHFINWRPLCGFVYDLFLFVWLHLWYPNIVEHDFPHLNAGGRLLSVKSGCSLSEQERLRLKMHEALHIPLKIISTVPYSIFHKPSSRHFWGRSWTPNVCRCSPHTPQNYTRKLQKRELPANISNTNQAIGPLFSRAALRSAHLFVFEC